MTLIPQRYSETLIPSLLDGIFQDVDSLMPSWSADGLTKDYVFPVDIEETERGYRVTADLPGVKAENVDISQAKDIITIKVERGEQRSGEKEAKRFLARERRSYSVSRTLVLKDLKPDGCEASLRDGVLTLELAKNEQVMPKKIAVTAG